MMGAAHANIGGVVMSPSTDVKLNGTAGTIGFTSAPSDEKGFNSGSGLGMLAGGPARLGGVPDANSNALTVQKRLPKEETV
jgi:hypothetical protein